VINVFRLALRRFATPLSGKGAAISGGRWNSKGVEMLYTASNRSLAMVEVVVHMTADTIPVDYVMVSIEMPDDISMIEMDEASLPKGWSRSPFGVETQRIGDAFCRSGNACVLRLPSAVTKGDSNLLLNPDHEHFDMIRVVAIENFSFDSRLIK
jgi:RES domain-containing protein